MERVRSHIINLCIHSSTMQICIESLLCHRHWALIAFASFYPRMLGSFMTHDFIIQEPARLLCPWNSPGKNTEVVSHFLLQGVLLTQGLNLGLLHCRHILYHVSCQGSTESCQTEPQWCQGPELKWESWREAKGSHQEEVGYNVLHLALIKMYPVFLRDAKKLSWESLGLQGDPTSPFWRRLALGALWKDDAKAETPVLWPPHAKSWLLGKDSDAGRDWGQEEKGTPEDEMAGWHHWLSGRESEWTPGVGDGQGGLVCCDSWCCKESDMTERLIWSDLIWRK